MAKDNKVLRIISASLETLLAIPIIGGSIVLGLFWTPLLIMLVLHIITLVMSKPGKKAGSVLGIIASALGWIPIVGWGLHVAAAIVLWVQSFSK